MPQLQGKLLQERGAEIDTQYHGRESSSEVSRDQVKITHLWEHHVKPMKSSHTSLDAEEIFCFNLSLPMEE